MTMGSTFGSRAVLSRHYASTSSGADSVGIYMSPGEHGGPGAGVRADRDAGITFQESYSIDWQRPSLFTWESR
jgi:hypothetical protein